MPVTTIGGQEVHVDEEGFLTEYDEWNEDLAKDCLLYTSDAADELT